MKGARAVDWINRHAEDAVSFLREMVMTPSVTNPPGGDEGNVQKVVVRKLIGMGLEPDIFEPDTVPGIRNHRGWWPGLDYKNRPDVAAVYAGTGGGRTLILNGHCDVVSPGELSAWKYPPFAGVIEGGKLYGRGATDMKGGLAAMIMAVQALRESGEPIRGKIILESAVNEELGGYNGTLGFIAKGYEGDAVIVGEPTDMKVEPGTKGVQGYKITVPGKGAHTGFWWEGVSALDKAIYIKKAIEDFARLRNRETREHPLYCDPVLFPIPAVTDCVYAFRAGDERIMGVPDGASMNVMIDIMPGEDLYEVSAAFERAIREACEKDEFLCEHPAVIEPIDMRPIYPSSVPLDHPIVESTKNACREITGAEPRVCGFEAACDAMMYNVFGKTPAMVFGPGKLQAAHRPDEYIEIEQYLQAIKAYALIAADFCG